MYVFLSICVFSHIFGQMVRHLVAERSVQRIYGPKSHFSAKHFSVGEMTEILTANLFFTEKLTEMWMENVPNKPAPSDFAILNGLFTHDSLVQRLENPGSLQQHNASKGWTLGWTASKGWTASRGWTAKGWKMIHLNSRF